MTNGVVTIGNKLSKKAKILIAVFFVVIVLIIASVLCLSNRNKETEKVDKLEKYTVKFIMEDGTVSYVEVEEGGIINVPAEPTKEGYIFMGWLLDGEPYDFSKRISSDAVLEASWKEKVSDKVYYKVYFDTVGGSFISSQELEEGSLVERPENNPIKDGYEFKGWKLSDVDYNFNEQIYSDVTIVAVWEKITSKESGVVPSSRPSSSTPSTPSNPNESTPSTPNSSTSPSSDSKKYIVKFDANGGTLGNGCSNQTIESGKKAENTCTATRSGYTLVGFNTSKTATKSNIESLSITTNTTYYAIWNKDQAMPIKYHITYNDNLTYGQGMDYYTHVPYSGKNTTIENDVYCIFENSKEHNCTLKSYDELFDSKYIVYHVFMGWSPDGRQSTKFYSPETSSKEDFMNILSTNATDADECDEGYVCKNVKLFAIWHLLVTWTYEDDSTIRFADGYSVDDFQNSYKNQPGYGFIKYVKLERDGYIFKGWKDEQHRLTLTSDVDYSNNVSWVVPLHFFAQWEKIPD